MIHHKIIISILFGLLFKTSIGQVTTSEQLLDVISQSIKDDYSFTNVWTTCNKDSLFFKSDTIELYNNSNYRQGFGCCYYLNWRFTDKFNFKQNFTEFCDEPPGETIYPNNDNLYKVEYVNKGNYVEMYVYKKNVLTNKYKVVAIDNTILDNNRDKCYKITLVRTQ